MHEAFCLVWISPIHKDASDGVIHVTISLVTTPIFEAVFNGGNTNDGTEGEDSQEGRSIGELRDELEDEHGQEIEVCDTAELLKEVSGDEGEQRVLGSAHVVGRERDSQRSRLQQ